MEPGPKVMRSPGRWDFGAKAYASITTYGSASRKNPSLFAPLRARIDRESTIRRQFRSGDTGGRGRRSVAAEFRIAAAGCGLRSEEHTSELQSLMRSSYAVLCLKK